MRELGIITVLLIGFLILTLSGCNIPIAKLNQASEEVAKLTKQCEPEKTVQSPDCAAGFHSGITATASLSENGRLGLAAINKYADESNPVYKCCYTIDAKFALEYEELAGVFRRGLDVISSGIGKVVTIP